MLGSMHAGCGAAPRPRTSPRSAPDRPGARCASAADRGTGAARPAAGDRSPRRAPARDRERLGVGREGAGAAAKQLARRLVKRMHKATQPSAEDCQASSSPSAARRCRSASRAATARSNAALGSNQCAFEDWVEPEIQHLADAIDHRMRRLCGHGASPGAAPGQPAMVKAALDHRQGVDRQLRRRHEHEQLERGAIGERCQQQAEIAAAAAQAERERGAPAEPGEGEAARRPAGRR